MTLGNLAKLVFWSVLSIKNWSFTEMSSFFVPVLFLWQEENLREQNILLFRKFGPYSRVHITSNSLFSKILKKPSMVQKKNDTSYKRAGFFTEMEQKKFKMANLENSKWPPQKNLIFQLRQFSIFFHENFMDWSLG